MPYSLEKVGKKYYVVDTSGRRYSKKPLSLVKAKKQITALHIHTGHGLCQSLLSTEYEEPVIPQMITRRFADDSAMHRTEEYPSIIPRKKKSIKSKIVDYIIESNKKDTGYGTYDWEKLGFVPKRFIKNPVHGKGTGGMMRNPLSINPEQEARKVVQRILDVENRAYSLNVGDGSKSLEKIMNEAALELARSGKIGAVQYLNELRTPLESNPNYTKDDAISRNKLARELGFIIVTGYSDKMGQGKGKRKYKGGSYETTLPLLEKSLNEIIQTMEYKLSKTPFQYLTNFLDKILKELNELIDEKGELPKLREFGLNFIRKLHPPEPLLELMHPEALRLKRELPSRIPNDYEVEQLNKDGIRLRRTVSPFEYLGPNRRIEDMRVMYGEYEKHPPPSRRYTDSDIIIPESEIDKLNTKMMDKKKYMDYIRSVGPPINTDPRNVDYLVTRMIPHSAKYYWDTAPGRPPQPKEKPREKRYGKPSTEGKGKYSEPDTHILIGDELNGSGRKDTLREEYELIMRRPNLTQQAKDDLVRIYQAGLHKLNQKGKSRILGILTNSKIAKEKDDILRNTIDLMHRRVPIQLIQRSRFSTELTPEQMSENLATSLLREYVDQEVDDPRNYVEKGEGKHKFVKKYLKGQGIPATKKNVEKICNIMDVEGVVFE